MPSCDASTVPPLAPWWQPPSLRDELQARGFGNLVPWLRGVDCTLFRPGSKAFLDAPRPISLYLEAFLSMRLPRTQYVVDDGPDLERLKANYPHVRFTGFLCGEDLAWHIGTADYMVFPSKTDTFGLTMLEAMACDVPWQPIP